MKLLINTESLAPPLTGIGNYTYNLLSALQDMIEIEQIACFDGYRLSSAERTLARCMSTSDSTLAQQPKSKPANHPIKLKDRLQRSSLAYQARETLRNCTLRIAARNKQHFVYHEPSFILKAHRGPCVATIHDLSFLRYPQFHPPKRVEWLVKQLPATLKRADAIITDSECIRQELIETYGIAPTDITAIHLGVSHRYSAQSRDTSQPILDRYGLSHGDYLLFVGTLEPRKGLDTLLDAWARIPARLQSAFPLVLAGAPGWNNDALQNRIRQACADSTLKHLSFVPEPDLAALYSGAALLICPSFYEGFGLPVLEAMACGTPTLCTAGTSMAEFSEGASALFDQGDALQLADRIEHLLENAELRANLSRKGLERASELTWERCARQTYAIYSRLAP